MKNSEWYSSIFLKLMRLSLLQLILWGFFSSLSFAREAKGQEALDQKVTFRARNQDVKTTIRQLGAAAQVRFMYSSLLIQADRIVSIEASDERLSDVLDRLFKPLHINYSTKGRLILLTAAGVGSRFADPLEGVEAPADRVITGTVTGENGQGLPGVNVLLKGTTRGASTDPDGKFRLEIPASGGTLVFSSVGYLAQEVTVGSQTNITVALQVDTKRLDEVVVIGYGTQKRADVTSAVVTVSGEQLTKRVVTNPATLLQGQLPGLQVIQNSGEPGNEGVNLRIRGTGTFSGAGNDPLVIVDGLPGSLTSINPNDIESVSVLKDASSAAIYGARGANGVVVITTKKGKEGRLSLQYTYNLGVTNATRLPQTITNSAEFMELNNEARTNSGLNPIYTQAMIDQYRNATDRNKYPNHNWLDDMFQTAYVQNHYLNLSGGKQGTNYSVGLGITDQPGVMKGFNYKKYTLQFNLNSKINDVVSFGTNTLVRYGKKSNPPQGSGDQFLSTLAQSPLYKPKLWDGSGRYTFRAFSGEQGNKNTIAIAENVKAVTDDYYGQLNGFVDVKVLPGLTWETRGGANFYFTKVNDFRPKIPLFLYSDLSQASDLDVGTQGLTITQTNGLYTVLYSQLTYDRLFGKHHVVALAGAQQEQNMDQSLAGSRRAFPTNALTELNAGPQDGMTNSGTTSRWAIRSFYGRLNYDYDNKYLVEGSIRNDGTSRLPTATRWGLFYSVSGGWRISQEAFLQQASWLTDLKIRGSWGRLGNQNIGTYPYQNVLSGVTYPFGGTLSTGYYAPGLVDPSLTWESTQVLDFGLDLTALKGRLNITADWFNKETSDILRSYQVPLYVGMNSPTVNNGAVRNTGWELAVGWQDKIGKDFSYRIGGNIQAYKNTLTSYGKTEIGGNSIRQEGKPLDEFYLYIWDGIFQNQAEIDGWAKQPIAPKPGDIKIRDVNGDGKIDASDRTYVSGKFPAASYSFNLSAAWKGFDLSAQIFGSFGQKIYVTGWGIEPFRQGSVPTVDWRNRWTEQNHSTTMPRIYVADSYPAIQNYASTYFLKDGSFARLKNLQLGYSLPAAVVKKAGMQSLRVYFSADNLLTWSKYPGLDPERTSTSGSYVAYPQNRVLTFGAMVQF